jgi:photosystem II stability/assembly factor-like uncharacterized protein
MNRKTEFGGFLSIMKTLGVVASSLLLIAPVSVSAQQSAADNQKPVIKSAKVAESLLQDIARAGDRLVVVGERGHIAYSNDNGKSWQQADDPTRAMLNAVFFISPEEGWAVGHDGLVLHSTDGGQNWAMQLDGLKFTRQRMADSIPVIEGKIKALAADKDAAEKQMDDAQLAGEEDAAAAAADEDAADAVAADDVDVSQFEEVIADIDEKISALETDLEDAKAALTNTVANPLMDVWFRDANTGFAVGAFGEFLKTGDGGVSWTSIADRLDNDERVHLNAITGKGDLMYIAGEAGHVYRSEDGGMHWSALSPDPENGSFFTVNIISDDQVFISGLRGAMYRSVDGGKSWKQVSESLHKNMNGIYFVGDTVLAAGNDGAFLRSRDGGRTFLPSPRKNRLTVASVTEAADGSYVLVGAGGVEIVAPDSLQSR